MEICGAIHYIARLWHQGLDCPHIEVPATLNTSNKAYVNSQRTRYVLTEVRLKEPYVFAGILQGDYDTSFFGYLQPGDIAFASGNLNKARAYFAEVIRTRPESADAWAGFAITFEREQSKGANTLVTQPELIAKVYAAIGDSTLDPFVVAEWLSGCKIGPFPWEKS